MTQRYWQPDRYRRIAALFDKVRSIIPGGVNSTARATWAGWDPHPLFISHGAGSRVTDVDGSEYIDYLLGLGPMLQGYRPPAVTHAVADQIERCAAVPSLERVRLCNTGTEAVLYSIRLARAFTSRSKIIRFEGMYHGFSDGIYWSKHSLDVIITTLSTSIQHTN